VEDLGQLDVEDLGQLYVEDLGQLGVFLLAQREPVLEVVAEVVAEGVVHDLFAWSWGGRRSCLRSPCSPGVPETGLYGDVVVDLFLQALPEQPAVAGFCHVGEHISSLNRDRVNLVLQERLTTPLPVVTITPAFQNLLRAGVAYSWLS